MPNIVITPVDLADRLHSDALVELLDHYARDVMGGGVQLPEAVRERLIPGLLEQTSYLGFLAFEAGFAVGLVNCFLGFSTFAARPLLNVHDVVVHRDYRRRGIGRELLAHAETAARARSCCKLTLEVLSGNPAAVALYADLGFRPYALHTAAGSAVFLQKNVGEPD